MPEDAAHPFIPNSAPAVCAEMLRALGISHVEELYASIPDRLRFRGHVDVPEALADEPALRRHVRGLLARNTTCEDSLSFLGGGCWQHAVPALCDEVSRRAEFTTAYWGSVYSDHGKYQAFFEYASLMGELLEMDAVSLPTYDWGTAAAVSLRMASRITGRDVVLVQRGLAPERLSTIRNYCEHAVDVEEIELDGESWLIDLDALARQLDPRVAAVYFENPSYFGAVEARGARISELAHAAGALAVVGIDPITLGLLAPPAAYGADIVCGELQPLGVHMDFGGGLAGFIATPDHDLYISEYPTFLVGIAPTELPGEHGFGLVAWERTSYMRRELGKDFGGTTTDLCAITAAVYLAAMGPAGMEDVGQAILQRSHYAAQRLSTVPGVRAPHLTAPYFKEFVVNFDATGRTVEEINRGLRERGIFGGRSLVRDFPELGESALYCVTEVHTQEDIDRLVTALGEVIER